MATRTDSLPIGIDDVHAAAERLGGVAHRTPVLTCGALDERCGGRVFLKAENFQRIGAFKFRGAYNAVTALAPRARRGVRVVGQPRPGRRAVRGAARPARGDPHAAGRAAVQARRHRGPTAPRCSSSTATAATATRCPTTSPRDRGLTLVHPYDEPLVMAGQGTVGARAARGRRRPRRRCSSRVGGGGLISGVATAVKALHPRTRVVGVEPEAGQDTQRSLARRPARAGRVERPIADGQRCAEPGDGPSPSSRRSSTTS